MQVCSYIYKVENTNWVQVKRAPLLVHFNRQALYNNFEKTYSYYKTVSECMHHNVELVAEKKFWSSYSVTLVQKFTGFKDKWGFHYSKYIIIIAESYWLRLVELRRIGFW